MTPPEVRRLFERFAAHNPQPRTELDYASPFQLLVAVALSAQATDQSVNRVTPRLFAVAPDAQALAALGEEGIAEHIRSLGLYRSKARNLAALAKILVAQHEGCVPRQRAELEALPGVGRKTANVVLNIVYGEPTIAVDTHIFRLANRLRLAPGKTVGEVEAGLMRAVPAEYQQNAHHWLILHGRYVCKARKPDCAACIVNDLCPSKGGGE